jgi:hypothetical protein
MDVGDEQNAHGYSQLDNPEAGAGRPIRARRSL